MAEPAAKPAETFIPSPGSKGGLNYLKTILFPNFCELRWVGDGLGRCTAARRQRGALAPAGNAPHRQMTPGHEQRDLQPGFCSSCQSGLRRRWGRTEVLCH